MDSNKVIIMEVKDDYAIAMTSDFEFIKIKKKKSMTEGQKIYIVDEAQKMTVQAQNALLKTIEEPPAYAVIMLLTTNQDAFLQTILSR